MEGSESCSCLCLAPSLLLREEDLVPEGVVFPEKPLLKNDSISMLADRQGEGMFFLNTSFEARQARRL